VPRRRGLPQRRRDTEVEEAKKKQRRSKEETFRGGLHGLLDYMD
jgi:hypothetical protein